MKILFISVYYTNFLKSFYERYGESVKKLSFNKHRQRLLGELFGDADFYSSGVKENGHFAEDIIANDEILQKKWAAEHNFTKFGRSGLISKIPYLRIFIKPNWVEDILLAQIKILSPNVLYFQDIEYFSSGFLKRINKKYFIVAQKASPIWKMGAFKDADLVFTSFPHFVKIFRANGIKSEYLKLAFGKKVLKIVPKQKKIYNCTFAGGITAHHSKGTRILSKVSEKLHLDVFGYGKNNLRKNSKLYKMHHGEIWGREMYKTLMQSRITINRHIDVAGKYANNMRLFEATGSGAMLLTDYKINYRDFFEDGKEIVTYRNANELIRKIKYYLHHPREREKIARAGQSKTLKNHNYKIRMGEMINLLSRYYP